MFIHHSTRPLRLDELRDGDQKYATDYGAKPNGLWFSVGDGADWRALVKERYDPDDISHQTEVVLLQSANVYRISGAQDIDVFTAKYGKPRNARVPAIDWARVATQFAGIVIAPHCKGRCDQEQTHWYKCWEVSSGCVWAASAIKLLRPLNY
jgi:hypothetical protein